MNLFDRLVDEALSHQNQFANLRPVIEKELLHHDILRILSEAGLLANLCFIGGTCLRACYGSNRLSEDLYFTGGQDFHRDSLANMAATLIKALQTKYGLTVDVSAPVRESGNVDTWKLKVQTRPARPDMPMQRIHIDVCAIPSYDVQPMLVMNHYGIDMGTSGLIIRAESREEIFMDKILALSLRPNRVKNRDLWDIAWLHQQGIKPKLDLLTLKIADHRSTPDDFLQNFENRVEQIRSEDHIAKLFRQEMQRFLPADIVQQTVDKAEFWAYINQLLKQLQRDVSDVLNRSTDNPPPPRFLM